MTSQQSDPKKQTSLNNIMGVSFRFRNNILFFITIIIVIILLAQRYIHSSCYYHNQIGRINLRYGHHIFTMVVCLICLLHHILSFIAYTFLENRDFVIIIIVRFMMNANNRIRFGWQTVFCCTLHHLIITIVQTNLNTLYLKHACQIYFVESIRLSICYLLSIKQYMGLFVFSLPISLVMIEKLYTYSYYHHQIGSLNH